MTRDQVINLRVGQWVRVSHFLPYLKITGIRVTRGARIVELERGVFVNVDQIQDVLPAVQAA